MQAQGTHYTWDRTAQEAEKGRAGEQRRVKELIRVEEAKASCHNWGGVSRLFSNLVLSPFVWGFAGVVTFEGAACSHHSNMGWRFSFKIVELVSGSWCTKDDLDFELPRGFDCQTALSKRWSFLDPAGGSSLASLSGARYSRWCLPQIGVVRCCQRCMWKDES